MLHHTQTSHIFKIYFHHLLWGKTNLKICICHIYTHTRVYKYIVHVWIQVYTHLSIKHIT